MNVNVRYNFPVLRGVSFLNFKLHLQFKMYVLCIWLLVQPSELHTLFWRGIYLHVPTGSLDKTLFSQNTSLIQSADNQIKIKMKQSKNKMQVVSNSSVTQTHELQGNILQNKQTTSLFTFIWRYPTVWFSSTLIFNFKFRSSAMIFFCLNV